MAAEENLLLYLAMRAVAEGWDAARAQAELEAVRPPPGEAFALLQTGVGAIADPAVALTVASWVDRLAQELIPPHVSDRLRGLMHLLLAAPWALRGQAQGDPAAWTAARRHFDLARPLVADDPMAMMMLGGLESMLATSGAPTWEQMPAELRRPFELLNELREAADADAFLDTHPELADATTLHLLRGAAQVASFQGAPAPAVEFLAAGVAQIDSWRTRRQPGPAPARADPPDLLAEAPPWLRAEMQRRAPAPPAAEDEEDESRRGWLGTLLAGLVGAEDAAAFAAVVAAWPEAHNPRILEPLEQLIAAVEGIGPDPGLARLRGLQRQAKTRLQRLHATQPLAGALWQFIAAPAGADKRAVVAAQPRLREPQALALLGGWIGQVEGRGAAVPAEELAENLCRLGRLWQHPPAGAVPPWGAALLRYLVEQERADLQRVVALAPADPPELGAILRALDEADYEQIEMLGRALEPRLWAAGRSAEALLVCLVRAYYPAMLVERFGETAPEEQPAALDLGIAACATAAAACAALGYEAGAAFFRGVEGSGLQHAMRLEDAVRAYQDAAERWERAAASGPGAYRWLWAKSLGNWGMALAAADQFAAAEERLQQAATAYDQVIGAAPDDAAPLADRGALLVNLCGLLARMGRHTEAAGIAQAAVDTLTRWEARMPQADPGVLPLAQINLGVILSVLRRLDAAASALEAGRDRLAALTDRAYETHKADLAGAHLNLSGVYVRQRQYTKAATEIQAASALFTPLAAGFPARYEPALANALIQQAVIQEELKQAPAAEAAYRDAVGRYRRLSAAEPLRFRPVLARALTNFAGYLSGQGQYAAAVPIFQEAISLRERLAAGQRAVYEPDLAATLVGWGTLLRDTGQPQAAETAFQRALTLDPENREDARWRARRAWARLLRDQGKPLPAYEQLHAAADELDAKRGTLDRPTDRRALQVEMVGVYRDLVDVCVALAAADKEMVWAERAWYWAEYAKGRTLLELLQPAGLDADSAQLQIPAPRELAGALRELAMERGAAARPLLVDYFLLGAGRYVVFLLPLWQVVAGAPLPLHVVPVPAEARGAGRIADLWAAGLAALRDVAAGRVRDVAPAADDLVVHTEEDLLRLAAWGPPRLFRELIAALGTIYLQPWAAHLADLAPSELILVPNGGLHFYPLHAALLADGTPLIAHYPLVYLPNAGLARTLAWRAAHAPRPSGRLVMGPPRKTRPGSKREDLPFARQETAALAQLWGLGEPYAFARMTTDALRRHAGQLAVAHLSTHAAFGFSDPAASHIMFHDEFLTLPALLAADSGYDFRGMRLFYLNGCESGLAALEVGDELNGLVWGLMYAGAEAVLATMWSVYDYSSAQMTDRFYYRWQPGTSLAVAYQQAVLSQRRDHPEPVDWAPFALYGNGF